MSELSNHGLRRMKEDYRLAVAALPRWGKRVNADDHAALIQCLHDLRVLINMRATYEIPEHEDAGTAAMQRIGVLRAKEEPAE